MGCVIRYAMVNPSRILNLTSPRYLPEISLRWMGRRPWHDPCYDDLRDMMEREYIDQFDRATGHFSDLLESVQAEGIRNPVVLTCGLLERRVTEEIPPAWRGVPHMLVSEHLGGSRIWAAQTLGIPVPAIINDHSGSLEIGEPLDGLEAVLAKFEDRPARALLRRSGSVDLNYMLTGDALQQQIETRRAIVEDIRRRVVGYLARMETA